MIGIYKITNQLNGHSYIGQSIHIEQRWEEHLYKSSGCSLLKYALYKYGKENFTFEVIEECTQFKLNEREIYWIKYYDTFNNGYNLTLGGSGVVKYSIETIYETFCQTNSMQKTAQQIGCHVNTVRSVLREYGINSSECQEAKPVECIDPTTLQTIRTFDSIQEAVDAMHVERATILMALKGINKTSCGYYWQFKGEQKIFEATTKIKKWKVKVQQLDYTTEEIVAEFNSAADAAESLGKDRKNGGSMIMSVCNGRKKSAYGFKWRKG